MTDLDQNKALGTGQNLSDTNDVALNSEDLLQGHREIKILHEGETYRLLVTRNGKLMLQK